MEVERIFQVRQIFHDIGRKAPWWRLLLDNAMLWLRLLLLLLVVVRSWFDNDVTTRHQSPRRHWCINHQRPTAHAIICTARTQYIANRLFSRLNSRLFLSTSVVYYLRQWNEENIGEDYEIGRSVCPCTLGGDMHSYERLLVVNVFADRLY